MKYCKFIIENYKGIKHLELDLTKHDGLKVFTFVGLNESGKTTILEAISLLTGYSDPIEMHSLIPKLEKLNFNQTVSIKALLKIDDTDREDFLKYFKDYDFKDVQLPDDILIERRFNFSQSEYSEQGSGYILHGRYMGLRKNSSKYKQIDSLQLSGFADYVGDSLPPIIYYEDFLFDFPERIYLKQLENEGYEQETYREVFDDILNSLNAGLNSQEHIIKRLENPTKGNKEALDSTLIKLGDSVTNKVFKTWNTLFGTKGKEIRIHADLDDEKGPYVEFKIKEKGSVYQISERSLGFNWFFTFLLFTEYRKDREEDTGEILFLLDEPASNLHSAAQQKLLQSFDRITDKSTLIYTTHSHHLINPDWLNGAFVVRNLANEYSEELDYDTERTEIEAVPYRKFVATHPDQKTYYQPILDTLDYQPGLLEEVPNIVITEGKNDYYTIKYFNQIYLNNQYDNIRLYPGAGANSNFQVIRLYLAWGRNFIILLDSDKAGKDAKKDYIKEFGPEIDSKIFTLENANEQFNNCAMEDLFSEKERLRLTQKFDPTSGIFQKNKFNTVIQNAFVNKENLGICKETIDNFHEILKFVKEKISSKLDTAES